MSLNPIFTKKSLQQLKISDHTSFRIKVIPKTNLKHFCELELKGKALQGGQNVWRRWQRTSHIYCTLGGLAQPG